MEKIWKFQIVYAGLKNLCQHSTTDLARAIMTNEHKRGRRHNLSNILKLEAAFLYSIYHQQAGKTSLFHMRGVDFTYFKTCCTFNTWKIMCNWMNFTKQLLVAASMKCTVIRTHNLGCSWCANYDGQVRSNKPHSRFNIIKDCLLVGCQLDSLE